MSSPCGRVARGCGGAGSPIGWAGRSTGSLRCGPTAAGPLLGSIDAARSVDRRELASRAPRHPTFRGGPTAGAAPSSPARNACAEWPLPLTAARGQDRHPFTCVPARPSDTPGSDAAPPGDASAPLEKPEDQESHRPVDRRVAGARPRGRAEPAVERAYDAHRRLGPGDRLEPVEGTLPPSTRVTGRPRGAPAAHARR
jgi:hypothetical protein